MKPIALSFAAMLFLTACIIPQLPSIQDSILATAALIEQVADATQIAYEANEITDTERQRIANDLQVGQDHILIAKQEFSDRDMVGALDGLSQALRFIEKAQTERGGL